MALQLAYTFKGIDIPESYHRIVLTNRDVEAENVAIRVAVYQNKTARENGTEPFEYKLFHANEENFETYFGVNVMDGANQNIVKLAYEYLQTLDEYSDTVVADA